MTIQNDDFEAQAKAREDDGWPPFYDPDPIAAKFKWGPSALQPDEEESMRRFGWLEPATDAVKDTPTP